MSDQITFLDALVGALNRASSYNRDDQVPPAVVLWTDKERQWEALLPSLRARLPILTLGQYKPSEWIGPVYWLRCVIARTLPEALIPSEVIPIIYLPGISKQEIRAIEDTPKMLRPLAELQYRGVLWTHKNGRDWTTSAFIQSNNGGLGIDISADIATKAALQRALRKLADEPIAHLKKEAPLRADFFDALLHPDEVRNLLLWLNDSAGYPKRCSAAEWASFCQLCKRNYAFDPERDGIITATALFGQHQGSWEVVWNRFKDNPHSYPRLPELLRSARPHQPSLFAYSESWPQDNEAAESSLRERLIALGTMYPDEVRITLRELKKEHAPRRSWVWATLGQSRLAMALQHLILLASETERVPGGATVAEIAAAYTEWGWRADAAVIDALAAIEYIEDMAAVRSVITALYRPWLERSAIALQRAVGASHPSQAYPVQRLAEPANGTCLLFCDGLRYDVGQRLVAALESQSLTCHIASHLAPLPTITSTAKPAISPVAKMISGKAGSSLEPVVTSSGTKVNAEVLKKVLSQHNYQVLNGDELGDPSGKGWIEMGAIDKYGHDHGWMLTHHLKDEVNALLRRIDALLNWGWKQVVVITDHGWLLLPGNLPKAELPEHLTHMRKGRCAQLKESSYTDQQTMPWYWNSDIQIALAPNICCYEAGKEYEHGGLSPQECIVPIITISRPSDGGSKAITIENISWRGLRCTINIRGATSSMQVDIRTKAGDPATSLTNTPKTLNADGTVSLLVPDEEQRGEAALIVILNSDGTIGQQISTIIGG